LENKNQLKSLLELLKKEVLAGLRHGFFDFSVTGEVKNEKRHVILNVGKSYKFIIPMQDIQEYSENNTTPMNGA
jgi:hypothetical protein